MRAAFLAIALCFAVVDAALARPLGYAHQLSHSITDSPSPAPDGQRLAYVALPPGAAPLLRPPIADPAALDPDGERTVQLVVRDDVGQMFVANLDATNPV